MAVKCFETSQYTKDNVIDIINETWPNPYSEDTKPWNHLKVMLVIGPFQLVSLFPSKSRFYLAMHHQRYSTIVIKFSMKNYNCPLTEYLLNTYMIFLISP